MLMTMFLAIKQGPASKPPLVPDLGWPAYVSVYCTYRFCIRREAHDIHYFVWQVCLRANCFIGSQSLAVAHITISQYVVYSSGLD